MHDLVIRNGAVVDGTGAPRYQADVAVDGPRITTVGRVEARGRREIDADGLLVTPGFVDIHTHFDAQATWDAVLEPSSSHGVTSVVMGNCGVGFAPVAPDAHEFLIRLMEGVEDIPGAVLSEGLTWGWETLPEYLDVLGRRRWTIDVGAQVPHAALRAYAMGERGADSNEEPTDEERDAMARHVADGLAAGYIGFSTSRSAIHRSADGDHIGTYRAGRAELEAMALAMRHSGLGVLQAVSDFEDVLGEFALLRRLAAISERPLSITLVQRDRDPDEWRQILDLIDTAAAEGLDVKVQFPLRPIGVLLGLQATLNPFSFTPTYRRLERLSLAARVAKMTQPEVRASILEQHRHHEPPEPWMATMSRSPDKYYRLGTPPDYEPEPTSHLEVEALTAGREVFDYVYDALLEDGGQRLLLYPVSNFSNRTLDHAYEMALSSHTLPGLSDAGAHAKVVCDGSFPTTNLQYWCRDRARGPKLELEYMVKKQTLDTASHVGWSDRGVVGEGYRADLNVIDFDQLTVGAPYLTADLPAGGTRFLQDAHGYRFTVCAGQVTFDGGEHTGALPGRLVRGRRAGPQRSSSPVGAAGGASERSHGQHGND